MKKIGYALIVAMCLLGLYTLGSAVIQLREDYSNFRKIVVWVAQKQALDAQQAQRAQQQRQQTAQSGTVGTPNPAPFLPTPDK